MVNLMNHDVFKQFICSLKDASLPKREAGKLQLPHVTHSDVMAIDFDKFTSKYAKSFDVKSTDDNPKSSDLLYQHKDGVIHLVEFKSSKPSKSGKDSVKLKALESLLTLMDLFGEIDREYARKYIVFILVFGEKKSIREEGRSRKLRNTGQPEIIYCGLERLKGIYFKNVITKPADDFESYIAEQGWTSMI